MSPHPRTLVTTTEKECELHGGWTAGAVGVVTSSSLTLGVAVAMGSDPYLLVNYSCSKVHTVTTGLSSLI